jgi:hypothetical protein
MNYWIKFPCNRVQYETLPIKQLQREYGLVSLSLKKETTIGDMHDRFRGRTKDVSFEQAKLILEHVLQYGLFEINN